jgi:hypothetical protein
MIRSQGVGSERSPARPYAASSCRTSLRQFLSSASRDARGSRLPRLLLGALRLLPRPHRNRSPRPGVCFAFDPDFIRNRYRSADLAFGSFTVSEEWPSGRHDESCSGEDGEVHVGAYEDHLGLETTETPFSSPVEGNRIAWGTVIEPPNVTATLANELEKREGTTVTFEGYLRVWNEGHFDDESDRRPGGFSNPNHILELHPTWRMQAQDGATRDYNLQAMSGLWRLWPEQAEDDSERICVSHVAHDVPGRRGALHPSPSRATV